MAAAAEVKKLVAPLLLRNPDLVLAKRLLVLRPLRHILRGVLIDRTSYGDRFQPYWFAYPLFRAGTSGYLAWSHILVARGRVWSHVENDVSERLCRQVEAEALPVLREIASIACFDRYARVHSQSAHMLKWLDYSAPLAVARGDFDAARTTCLQEIEAREVARFGRDEDDRSMLRQLKDLCRRLAADDRDGLAALLHEWEATTVKNLKLERLWEPTPFPLEQA